MTRRDIPNLISALRLLLVAPVVVLIVAESFGYALLLFFIAGLSDGIDGFLAKRCGWQTALGAVLDPLADKLLMVASIGALALDGLVPWWLLAVIVLRDVAIVAGAISYRYWLGRFSPSPSLLSKLNTGVQILLVLAVLGAQLAQPGVDLQALFLLAAATAIASGTHYSVQWGCRARRVWRSVRSRRSA